MCNNNKYKKERTQIVFKRLIEKSIVNLIYIYIYIFIDLDIQNYFNN